jgi:hypothetical protein
MHKPAHSISPPQPPAHIGPPLKIGETCLLRRPGSWYDVVVQLRGIDGDLAAIRIVDHFETVQLAYLRRLIVP